jgi:hypothetical protein
MLTNLNAATDYFLGEKQFVDALNSKDDRGAMRYVRARINDISQQDCESIVYLAGTRLDIRKAKDKLEAVAK